MKSSLLSYLKCPVCPAGLTVKSSISRNGEIKEGILTCLNCRQEYLITNFIPRLLPKNLIPEEKRTAKTFGYQWKYFGTMIPEWKFNFLQYFWPNDESYFRGKVILDAGCGFGRHAYYAAKSGKELIAMDLSEAVDRCFDNLKSLPNCHVVQGSILHPPFKPVFDLVYSIGVLQHIPQGGRSAFNKLVSLLKPGGDIFIWVYGRNWTKKRLYRAKMLLRKIVRHTPFFITKWMCFFLGGLFYLKGNFIPRKFGIYKKPDIQLKIKDGDFGFLQYEYPFWVFYTDVFDFLTAPVIRPFEKEDLNELFRENGMREYQICSIHEGLDQEYRAFGKTIFQSKAQEIKEHRKIGRNHGVPLHVHKAVH